MMTCCRAEHGYLIHCALPCLPRVPPSPVNDREEDPSLPQPNLQSRRNSQAQPHQVRHTGVLSHDGQRGHRQAHKVTHG